MRDEIFQPVYWRKLHDKRNYLKSEDISRTLNNKEPLQTFVDQKIHTIPENIDEVKPENILKELPLKNARKSISLSRVKPKTASSMQKNPHKKIKKRKNYPIKLASFKKPETAPQQVDSMENQGRKWEDQTKLWNELTDMYEIELKRIKEIRQQKEKPKQKQENNKKQQENMRRTGGGFTQMNFFTKD